MRRAWSRSIFPRPYGPVTLLQWAFGRPLAMGPAATGLLAGLLLWGLVLGVLFPYVHRPLQSGLDATEQENEDPVLFSAAGQSTDTG